jgi:hypothetical protein
VKLRRNQGGGLAVIVYIGDLFERLVLTPVGGATTTHDTRPYRACVFDRPRRRRPSPTCDEPRHISQETHSTEPPYMAGGADRA